MRKALRRAILLSSRGVKEIPTIFCDFYETAFEIVSHPEQKFFLLSNSHGGSKQPLVPSRD
jgi:succinate dehydrogenase flavin-adding protein (antitoxin of CptAB toxin-antitoxin module)